MTCPSISGRLIDQSGTSVEGYKVSFQKAVFLSNFIASAVTDENGYYRLIYDTDRITPDASMSLKFATCFRAEGDCNTGINNKYVEYSVPVEFEEIDGILHVEKGTHELIHMTPLQFNLVAEEGVIVSSLSLGVVDSRLSKVTSGSTNSIRMDYHGYSDMQTEFEVKYRIDGESYTKYLSIYFERDKLLVYNFEI